jgi:AraC-like DNA-binding protein
MQSKNLTYTEHHYSPFDKPFYIGRHGPHREIQAQKKLRNLHTHAGLEIAGIISGTAAEYFNGKRYPVKRGDLLIIDPVFFHEMGDNDSIDLIDCHLTRESVVAAHFDSSDLFMLRPFAALQRGASPVISGMGSCVEELVKAWKLFGTRKAADKQRAFLMVVGVIVRAAEAMGCLSMSGKEESRPARYAFVPRAMEFIHEHLQDDIALDTLAAHLTVSKSRLCHGFKEYAGISPIEYRTRVRIGRAVDLLKATNQKLTSIALDCGFNNLTAFHRLFKKTTGMTPAQLRKG